MFDMRQIKTRYFELRLPNGLRIEVEPPRIKPLKKMMSLAKVDDEEITDDVLSGLVEALSMALSKNKQGKTITTDFIDDNMNIDQVQDLLTAYFEWVDSIKQSKN